MLKAFAAFFVFGATMCTLTIGLLLFPGPALFTLASKSRSARFFPINRERCLPVTASGWDWVRFGCHRTMASQGVGHLASDYYPFSKHRCRLIECGRSP